MEVDGVAVGVFCFGLCVASRLEVVEASSEGAGAGSSEGAGADPGEGAGVDVLVVGEDVVVEGSVLEASSSSMSGLTRSAY